MSVFNTFSPVNNRPGSPQTEGPVKAKFFWRAMIWPFMFFFLSLAAIYFYPLLPAEVAYRFSTDGLPDAWLSRGVFFGIILGSQALLLLMAGVVGLLMSRVLRRVNDRRIERLAALLISMPVLPQVLVFALAANIFGYNIYGVGPLPVWPLALGIIGAGTVLLAFLFYHAIRRGQKEKNWKQEKLL